MVRKSSVSRREFLRLTRDAALVAGVVAPSVFLNRTFAATGQNPSELVRLGFIGVGNQGMSNLQALVAHAAAVCDVDSSHMASAKKFVEERNHQPCQCFHDYREMIDSGNIDGVVISTPDHWHALPAIHACEAGKDVYCEKPLTLFITEGQALVKATRRNKRVFQVGSQQRSDSKFRRACEYVRSGMIGKVKSVKIGLPGVNWKSRGGTDVVPDSAPPPELDWNFWLGPAPARSYNINRAHYLFRFYWDYSGGQMTNWGAHHIDIAQWGLGMDESGPVEIQRDGKPVYNPEGLFETPDQFNLVYKYGNGVSMHVSAGTDKHRGGTLFEGEKGSIYVNRGVIESTPEEILEQPLGDDAVRLYKSDDHHRNFIECVKTRKDPICTAEVGHRSATVCHLGNIAVRTGKKVVWDPKAERIVGDAEMVRWASRPYRTPWKLSG